jgi:hypothetical protein
MSSCRAVAADYDEFMAFKAEQEATRARMMANDPDYAAFVQMKETRARQAPPPAAGPPGLPGAWATPMPTATLEQPGSASTDVHQ